MASSSGAFVRSARGGVASTAQANAAEASKAQAAVAGHRRILAIPAREHSSSFSWDNAPATPQAPSILPLRKIGNPPRTQIADVPSPMTVPTGV